MINLYPSDFPHTNGYVVGDVTALTKLRDAIDRAISGDDIPATLTDFDSDGEGYEIVVVPLEQSQAINLPAPYMDEAYCDPSAAYEEAEGVFMKVKQAKLK